MSKKFLVTNSNTFSNLSDLELVAHYSQTDNKVCVGILFERYSSLVYAICLKYFKDPDESRDAAMHVFEKLFSDLKKHSISNFRSWLHSVTKNHCLMQLRKFKDIKIIGGETGQLITPIVEYHEFQHQTDEKELEVKLSEVENAILELSAEQKICIELFYLKEKSYQEVAEITGYSLNKVKSYIQNGKRNLKLIISKKNGSQK